MRYVAVVHSWFIHSKGFEIKEIEASTEDDAQMVADAFAHQVGDDFKSTAVLLLKIGEQRIIQPRRLTWKERISGRIE
jgi:hypothetical protein